MIANPKSSGAGAPNIRPETAQQMPLTIIAHDAMRAWPMRSANHQAAADPIAPLPIVANATADPASELGVGPPRLKLAAANAAIHVQTA